MKRFGANALHAILLGALVGMFSIAGNARTTNFDTIQHAPIAARQQRIQGHLAPLKIGSTELASLNLPDLMRLLRVPGVSVAVIDDFDIAWAKGYGVARAGSTVPVTPNTLFQAGSISKPVAAAGALSMVDRGELSLDEDVNRRLVSWKVPESPFTKDQKVTLRRILSHTAGTTGHFFPGYAADVPRPTLVQVLAGEPPANTVPVVVSSVPGSTWRYSGGGMCIAQLLMTDVSGRPFPEILRERVFDRIGMNSSTFEQPLPPALTSRAASGTHEDGTEVPGRWHVYPEMAAAGLWTTPTDLARFAIEMERSVQGRANRALSQETAREMLSPQFPRVGEPTWGDKQRPDRMGLGFFLGDSTRPARFGHIGDDEGFSAILILFGDTGQGAAIMVNSSHGIVLAYVLLAAVANEYGWGFAPPLYPILRTLIYLLLSVRVALALASALGVYFVLSRRRSAWLAFSLALLLTLVSHAIAMRFSLWRPWIVHPPGGPDGGIQALMLAPVAILLIGPVWRRRNGS